MPLFIRQALVSLIKLYQHTLSPDHGPLKTFFPYGVCRFHPTCSQYTKESINNYGWHGLFLGLKQLSRCHPYL